MKKLSAFFFVDKPLRTSNSASTGSIFNSCAISFFLVFWSFERLRNSICKSFITFFLFFINGIKIPIYKNRLLGSFAQATDRHRFMVYSAEKSLFGNSTCKGNNYFFSEYLFRFFSCNFFHATSGHHFADPRLPTTAINANSTAGRSLSAIV